MDRAEVRKYYQDRMAKLMAKVQVNNDTHFHYLDEAMCHLIDHFDPPRNRFEFNKDHALIMGAAYLGHDNDNEDMGCRPAVFYLHGDTHELSHTMADAMRDNPVFARLIFHAVEVFALHKPDGNRFDL